MAATCRICEFRNEALTSTTSRLHVRIISLTFKVPIMPPTPNSNTPLSTLLYNIVDNQDAAPSSSTFTAWSPCLNDPKSVVIITTIQHVCDDATSSIFNVVKEQLANPPEILHATLDIDALSLAPSSPEQRIACDIIQLQSNKPLVTRSIGRQFGWNPKRSSLLPKVENGTSSNLGHPGDLIKDFRVWAEKTHEEPRKLSTSAGSSALSSSSLVSLDSDRGDQQTSISLPGDKLQLCNPDHEETLLMIFQWSSHANGNRFKDQSQSSYGPNEAVVSSSLWEREVAIPIGQLQQKGAKVETYSLELRSVEPRLRDQSNGEMIDVPVVTGGRRRRLTNMATDLGEKVSRLWK